MLGRAAVALVDGDRRERLARGQQDARPDLADVMAGLLGHALLLHLVDPVADDPRRLAVEHAARVDDRPRAPVEVGAVEHALGRVVGDRDHADLLDVRRVADVEELHAAGRRAGRHALGHADGVEVARDRQHLAVGRDLLVLPRDVGLHPAEVLRLRGVGDVVDRDVLAGGHEHPVADHLGARREADVLLERAQVLDVVGHHRVRPGGQGARHVGQLRDRELLGRGGRGEGEREQEGERE